MASNTMSQCYNKQGHVLLDNKLDDLKRKYKITENGDFAILCRGNLSAKRASYFLETNNKLFTDTLLDNSNSYWGTLFKDLLTSFFAFKKKQSTKLDFVDQYLNDEYDRKSYEKGLLLIDKIFSLEESLLKENFHLFKSFAELVFPDHEDDNICIITKDILKDKEKLVNFKPATENEISIMTLHKSKGLEFKFVFLLDSYRWILPPEHHNVTEEEYKQALNLHYVGVTRAIEVVILW